MDYGNDTSERSIDFALYFFYNIPHRLAHGCADFTKLGHRFQIAVRSFLGSRPVAKKFPMAPDTMCYIYRDRILASSHRIADFGALWRVNSGFLFLSGKRNSGDPTSRHFTGSGARPPLFRFVYAPVEKPTRENATRPEPHTERIRRFPRLRPTQLPYPRSAGGKMVTIAFPTRTSPVGPGKFRKLTPSHATSQMGDYRVGPYALAALQVFSYMAYI